MAQSVNRFIGGGMPRVYSEMKSALDLLGQYNNIQKMSTGSAELDSLIDGLQQGLFYLFYGTPDNQLILDSLLNRMLVGCILPKNDKRHGFESMAVLFNSVNYPTDRNKYQLLNPEKIAIVSKYADIDPKIVFKNLFVEAAYNLEHQLTVAEEIADTIGSNPDIKLVAIRDLTRFITRDRDLNWNATDDSNTLKTTLGTLYRVCTKNKVAVVATGSCNITNSGIVPKPNGGTYLKHLANVLVNIKPSYWSTATNSSSNGTSPYATFKAAMVKHPYQLTPKSTIFYAKRIGRRKNPMLFIFD